MGYASSQHLAAIEDYIPDAQKAKEMGYKGYKIHPGAGQHRDGPPIPTYIGHMEEIKDLRKSLGDEFVLAHDPVQAIQPLRGAQGRAACWTSSITSGSKIPSAPPIWMALWNSATRSIFLCT